MVKYKPRLRSLITRSLRWNASMRTTSLTLRTIWKSYKRSLSKQILRASEWDDLCKTRKLLLESMVKAKRITSMNLRPSWLKSGSRNGLRTTRKRSRWWTSTSETLRSLRMRLTRSRSKQDSNQTKRLWQPSSKLKSRTIHFITMWTLLTQTWMWLKRQTRT
mgnify:CR=1 FL=1